MKHRYATTIGKSVFYQCFIRGDLSHPDFIVRGLHELIET